MRRTLLALVLATTAVSSEAQAQTPADLGQCMADFSTGKDRREMIRLVVASMTQHPALADLSTISDAQLEEITRAAAHVMERLITVDCKAAFKTAYAAGGDLAVSSGFSSLGRIAMRELYANPKVAASLGGLVKYVNIKKIDQLKAE